MTRCDWRIIFEFLIKKCQTVVIQVSPFLLFLCDGYSTTLLHYYGQKINVFTYTDVVTFQWKCFSRDITTWKISKYFVIASVPLYGKKLFIFKCKSTVELNIVTTKHSVRNVDFKIAQSAGRH